MRDDKKLVIVVPCYNESECLENSANKLLDKLRSLSDSGLISKDSQICFVNDGSTDNTSEILDKLSDSSAVYSVINFTGNFGHQYAIYAGMITVDADMVITVDADLQDDLDAMDEMINLYHEGFEIVYGCRKSRNEDSFFKKNTAIMYYCLMKILCPEMHFNHADYRLMSRHALDLVKKYPEKSIFLRGMIPKIGLKFAKVYYDRKPRLAGEAKYNLYKMFELAWRGVVNYSVLPLRIILLSGFILFLASTSLLILNAIAGSNDKIFLLILSLAMFTGLILFSLGVVSEYVALILCEVKSRPPFLIESTRNIKK